MKKISEYKNEDAIDLLADLIEPASKIIGSEGFQEKVSNCESNIEIVKMLLKNYKSEIVEILAVIEGVPVDKYSANIITMTKDILELVSDKELVDFLSLQGEKM